MCTLTVITRDDGYLMGMNRDERLACGAAAPPSPIALGGTVAVYPRDIEGGTWIAANDLGITFALLNWNGVLAAGAERRKTRSRGYVIPELVHLSSLPDVQLRLETLDLCGVLPFRLAGIFPAEKQMVEWRWDMDTLQFQLGDWKPRHWFSSGLSDEQAAGERGAACREAWREQDAGSSAWLRRLHASHANGPGPFSICVHRKDAGTLSYTEIRCTAERVKCSYSSGSPCAMREEGPSAAATLPRRRAAALRGNLAFEQAL